MRGRGLLLGAGAFDISFGVFHVVFFPFLGMAGLLEDYTAVPVLYNLMKIATGALAFIFLGLGVLLIFKRDDVLEASLGRTLVVGAGTFWVARLLMQLLFIPWPYQTPMSFVFSAVFAAGAALHLAAALPVRRTAAAA